MDFQKPVKAKCKQQKKEVKYGFPWAYKEHSVILWKEKNNYKSKIIRRNAHRWVVKCGKKQKIQINVGACIKLQ